MSLLADCSGGAGSRTAKAWRKATAAVSHSLRRLQDAQAHAKGILSLARGVHAGIDLRNVQQFARTAQLRDKGDGDNFEPSHCRLPRRGCSRFSAPGKPDPSREMA